MSTSLAEQLKNLAVPQTDSLAIKKKHISLLFDPKDASGLRRETIYQIGLDGLEELIEKNDIFLQFKSNLFHFTSKEYERSVLNDENNMNLDKVIRRFLLLLSPYFLLTSTHKALEWLINRYNIHEYNRDDLLMLSLPYHESNIFVRLIQLMKFKDENDPWYFLKSIQKTGVHLSRKTLLKRATNDVYIIKYVKNLIFMLINEHRDFSLLTISFNFYCIIYVGLIELSNKLNEKQISQMLPPILKGLKSNIPDFCASSLVIIGKLLLKTTLDEKVLEQFINNITKNNIESLYMESIMTMIILYQTQKHFSGIPDEAIDNISKMNNLQKILEKLNNDGIYIYTFLEQLFRTFIKNILILEESYKDFFETLLSLEFNNIFIENFLEMILDEKDWKLKKLSKTQKNWLAHILETIEKQYPDKFDKEVYKILSSTGKDKNIIKRKKCLQILMKSTMILNMKFNIFDKIYHSNPLYREEAIKYLNKNFLTLKDREKEMIKCSLIDRLNDDNKDIILETLILINKFSFFDNNTLRLQLMKLSLKCQKNNWKLLGYQVILTLINIIESNDWNCFFIIFPYLFPEDKIQLKQSIQLFNTNYFINNPLFKNKLFEKKRISTLQNSVLNNLKNDKYDIINEIIETLSKDNFTDIDTFNKYIIIFVLSNILPYNSSQDICVLLLDIFNIYIKNIEKSYIITDNFINYFNIAREDKLPYNSFINCIHILILKTNLTLNNKNTFTIIDFSLNNTKSRYFILIFNFLCDNNIDYKLHLQKFLDSFCKTLESKLIFLLNLLLCDKLNGNYQEKNLNLIITLLKNSKNNCKTLNIDNNLLAFILSLLLNKSELIIKKIMRIIEILLDYSIEYKLFLQKILSKQEEIFHNNKSLMLILKSLYESDNKKFNEIINSLINIACNLNSPIYLKLYLMELFTYINSYEILENISQIGINILQTNLIDCNLHESIIILKIINKYDLLITNNINLSSNIWKFMELCLKNDKIEIINNNTITYPSILMVQQIDKEIFDNLNETIQSNILNEIIEISTISQNPEILPIISRFIKHIDLNGQLILTYFIKMRDIESNKLDLIKRRKRNVIPTIDILDTIEWRQGITVLEFIQDKKKIRSIESIIIILFDVLKKCLDFDEQAAVEYTKQLILSFILFNSSKLNINLIPETQFNIELIVQCIRASQNPQTHHYALLLLAYSAKIYPTQVLHHIMAIFTFMGSAVLRHDDAYSYQIITNIIDSVIPIMLKDNDNESIINVLRVFVDVILDVPEHRQIPLYKHLLEKIDVDENLYLFLLLIFEAHVVHSSQERQKHSISAKRLDIATQLCYEFTPEIIIQCCINTFEYIRELPDEKTDNIDITTNNRKTALTFDIGRHTPKQFRYYKYAIITFMANLLSSKELINQIASLDDDKISSMENYYKNFLISILLFIQKIHKVSQANLETPQNEYWKRILHFSYDILDSVNSFLTPQLFILVIKSLMVHSLLNVRKRALELLNSKLQHNTQLFLTLNKSEIYSLIPPLIGIIEDINKNNLEQEQELLIQTALLSLQLLIKHLANEYTNKFIEILNYITILIKKIDINDNILASLILCLTEFCVNLRAHSISTLRNFMPTLIKILKHQKQQNSPNLVLLSILTAIQKLFDILPLFLNPYLEKLIRIICILSSKWISDIDDIQIQTFINKLLDIQQSIGKNIPARLIIPIINEIFNNLMDKKQYLCIPHLMNILTITIKNFKLNDINLYLSDLTNLYLNILQFRTISDTTFNDKNLIENSIIKTVTLVVLKLSEKNFRPFYNKFFDWAIRKDDKNESIITYYLLTYDIAECLKGLFVIFAGQFINNAATILDACNINKNKELYFYNEENNILLLETILKVLLSIFNYNNQKFVNKDRFDILMQPIVDQLENTIGGIDALEKRNKYIITPCLIQFIIATADDSLWKQLNYQILLKMRHSNGKIRIIALECLIEFVNKLKEEFLPLLPETIPFLAELLEDEDENVEKQTQKAVQEMEKYLGEPLQKYF